MVANNGKLRLSPWKSSTAYQRLARNHPDEALSAYELTNEKSRPSLRIQTPSHARELAAIRFALFYKLSLKVDFGFSLKEATHGVCISYMGAAQRLDNLLAIVG